MQQTIKYKTGNILTEDVEALVNTVNCVGIMGKGIALQFKKTFPENFYAYAVACKKSEVKPGHMFVFATDQLWNPHYIINFPTKRHWRNMSNLLDIKTGLEALILEIQSLNIQSIAIPPLGCGNGGLDWLKVRPLIEQALSPLQDVQIIIFEPANMSV